MIRDYPDVVSGGITPASSAPSTPPMSPALGSSSPLPNTTGQLPPPVPSRPVPPPRHPTQTLQPTYTPYIPRSRRGPTSGGPVGDPLSATGQPIPLITSSAQGGVTTRHTVSTLGLQSTHQGPSAALLDKVRALDALPRLGALRTLDLRGNDIRVSFECVTLEEYLLKCYRPGSPMSLKC
jgi:protein phosphatase 1 regulatory subunit 37